MRPIALIFALFCFFTTRAQDLESTLDSLMNQAFSADSAGGALMLIVNGQVVYKKARGLADVVSKEPLTPLSNFRMASVSKQFTAMAILLLEKEGKLRLDDNLRHFFPEFAPVGARITVQQLLTHTSGVVDYEDRIPDTTTQQLSDRDVLRLVQNVDSTYFPSGTQFRYSNSGYCLLALIVEKASGKAFNTFLRQNIFLPLGMTHSQVYDERRKIEHRAFGYARDKKGALVPSDQSLTSATKGDGGVYTSLNDVQKWYEALWSGRFLDLERQLSTLKYPLSKQRGYYAAGWFFEEDAEKGLKMFHSGSTCGFSNVVICVPKQKMALVFFSNIAGNHALLDSFYAFLRQKGLVDVDIWPWHKATN